MYDVVYELVRTRVRTSEKAFWEPPNFRPARPSTCNELVASGMVCGVARPGTGFVLIVVRPTCALEWAHSPARAPTLYSLRGRDKVGA